MANWEKIKGGASLPFGSWRRVTPLLSVQGIQYRKENALAFAKASFKLHHSGGAFGLMIEREPENPHDKNALKVIGWGAAAERHIGYVDAVEASRAAERYPNCQIAGEFYSLYLSRGGFIDVAYFLSVPEDEKPISSGRVRSLLEYTKDELLVLSYAARADNKLGRLEAGILNRYALERAQDFRISLVDEDLSDIKNWCKEQLPTSDEVEAAIHRLADCPNFSPRTLWELIEIVLGVDGKISRSEKLVAAELAAYIREAFHSPTV